MVIPITYWLSECETIIFRFGINRPGEMALVAVFLLPEQFYDGLNIAPEECF